MRLTRAQYDFDVPVPKISPFRFLTTLISVEYLITVEIHRPGHHPLKFVKIGSQTYQTIVRDSLKTLDEKLSEMTSIQSTVGSKIVKFYGHYR